MYGESNGGRIAATIILVISGITFERTLKTSFVPNSSTCELYNLIENLGSKFGRKMAQVYRGHQLGAPSWNRKKNGSGDRLGVTNGGCQAVGASGGAIFISLRTTRTSVRPSVTRVLMSVDRGHGLHRGHGARSRSVLGSYRASPYIEDTKRNG